MTSPKPKISERPTWDNQPVPGSLVISPYWVQITFQIAVSSVDDTSARLTGVTYNSFNNRNYDSLTCHVRSNDGLTVIYP